MPETTVNELLEINSKDKKCKIRGHDLYMTADNKGKLIYKCMYCAYIKYATKSKI